MELAGWRVGEAVQMVRRSPLAGWVAAHLLDCELRAQRAATVAAARPAAAMPAAAAAAATAARQRSWSRRGAVG